MKKLILSLGITLLTLQVFAATITSTTTGGNWSSSGTWLGGNVPSSSDHVVINGAVALNANYTCVNLTVNTGKTLTINAGYTLTAAKLTNNGSTIFQAGGSNKLLLNNTSWTTVLTNSGTFTANTGTVEFSGSGNAHTVSGTVIFYNVVLSNVQQMNFGSASTVNGTIRINSGAYITTHPAYGSNSVMEVNRSISMNNNYYLWGSSSNTTPATISIISGTVVSEQMNLYVRKKITVSSGATLSAAKTCLYFTSGFEGISNNGTITLGGITVENGATWNVNSNYTLSTLKIENGGTVNANSYTLTMNAERNNCNISSSMMDVSNGGTFNAGSGTVAFNPPYWLNINATNSGPGLVFNNIVVNGPGTIDMPNNNSVTIGGNLTINSSGTLNDPDKITFTPTATVTNNGSTSNGSIPSSVPTTTTSSISGSSGGGSYTAPMSISSQYTLTSDLTVNGASRNILIISPGAELITSSYKVNCDTVFLYGKMSVSSLSGITSAVGSSTKIVIGSGSTVNYSATSGTQIITARTDYKNVELSGGATKAFASGTFNISGDLISTSSSISFSNNPVINFNGTTQNIAGLPFNNVTFSNSGDKTLTDTAKVTGVITVSGSANLVSGGKLVLVSNASGTASIAALTGSANVSGNVIIQRYIPAVDRRYRMISPNASGFTYAQLKDDIFVTGSGGSGNGFDASSQNQTTVYTYQESTTGGRGWKAVTNISNTLDAGKGAFVFIRGDRTLPSPQWYTAPYVSQNEVTIDFEGPINKGTFSPSVTYTNTGSSADDGWNMVGNPYPSQISWAAVTKNNLDAFCYIYNPTTNSYEALSDNIASGQAFFVRATGASPSITFTESCKVSSSPSSFFKAATARLTVKMIKDSLNSDVAWLVPSASSSINYLPTEDAIKFENALLNLSFVTADAIRVQYNKVPVVNTSDTFALRADAAAGTYTIVFSGLSAVSASKSILLKDLFTNTITDIRSNPSYTYSITSNPLSAGDRFQVIIIDPSALPVKYSHFTGTRTNQGVVLSWATATEINSNHFEIEKSSDAKTFINIGEVRATGSMNSQTNYTFTDSKPFAGTSYYRLRQVDHNGTFHYSDLVVISGSAVTAKAASSVSVFPVPAVNEITIQSAEAMTGYTIYDISGKAVKTSADQLPGSSVIDISALEKGIYFISVETPAAETGSIKFIKQ